MAFFSLLYINIKQKQHSTSEPFWLHHFKKNSLERGQTNKHTHRQTLWLLDRIGNRKATVIPQPPYWCHMKDNWHSYVYKMHFLIKCLLVALDKVKVQIKVFNASWVLVLYETLIWYFQDHRILKGLNNKQKNHSKPLLGKTSKVNHQFYHCRLEPA